MPADWKVGLICPIYKKGYPLENYRGITLANVGDKVFSKVLFQEAEATVKANVGIYQCAFIADKSTSAQIFTLRQIMEKLQNMELKHIIC
jgi:23S rRNA maturation mini-RNase III